MSYRVAPTVVFLTVTTLFTSGSLAIPQSQGATPLVVHEWGTFTSVAGEDGKAMQWVPRQPPEELPCFVERTRLNVKGYLPGTVRMETPVLYFYSPAQMSVDVDVRFRQGAFTEWYPKARVNPAELDLLAYRRPDFEGSISWPGVTIVPGAATDIANDGRKSHYYQARDTDAATVRVGSQTERFLFYRGVALFAPPIDTTITGEGRVTVKSSIDRPMGDLVLFENHNGTMASRVVRAATGRMTVDLPDLDESPASPAGTLEDLLVGQGLYRKEAAAMVNTWRDSWFEEGTRLFYFMPQASVDEILPLAIRPRPSSVVRVFVGRIEIATPGVLEDLRQAMIAGDTRAMRKHGRFLQPFLDRVLARADQRERVTLEQRLKDNSAALWSVSAAPGCN